MTATPPASANADLLARIGPVDEEARASAAEAVAGLATPPGALGRLGDLATVLAAIGGRATPPPIVRPGLVIAAADHGVQLHGVSPYPQEVTALMVRTFCEGRGTANVIADAVGAEVLVLDVGVAGPVRDHPDLRSRRVRPGTRDLSAGPAMTVGEAGRRSRRVPTPPGNCSMRGWTCWSPATWASATPRRPRRSSRPSRGPTPPR